MGITRVSDALRKKLEEKCSKKALQQLKELEQEGRLNELFCLIPQRSEEMLAMRYDDHKPVKVQQLAAHFNVCPGRIYQVQAKTISKINSILEYIAGPDYRRIMPCQ